MTIIRRKPNAFYLTILCGVLSLIPLNGISQGTNIIPPSPNSSEFTKYIDLPVNEFTGIPNITIPLYEIIGKDIEMPISLSYHASGIRVSQLSGSVGLGWSLNAGGVITRSVRGTPDDYYNEDYFYVRGILHTNFNAESWMEGDLTSKSLTAYLGMDMEPDVFYYNFNGNFGKFIFNQERQCTLIPKNDYVVKYSMEENSSITDFTIITDDGTEYFFDACETTIGNYPNSEESNSSWLLTRIKTQQETITITYENEKFSEEILNSELCYIDSDGTAHKWDRFDFTPVLTYTTKRISRIDWSGGYVTFGKGVLRQDIKQPDEQELKVYSIGNIVVYNNKGNKIKEYALDYSYFNSDCTLIFEEKYLCNRLMLESVTAKAESKSLPPYEFSYNPTALPPRTSYEQDYWGFYNSNNATTFIPNIWAYPGDNNPSYLSHFSIFKRNNYDGQEYLINPGTNRSTNASVIQAGVLYRIKYPTGGFAEYTYEPHTFYFDGSNKIGGGIRVQKVKAKTNASTTAIEKEYKYIMSDNSSISSGRIIRLPEFAFWRTNIVGYNITCIEDMRAATFITTGTLSSLEEAQGSYVAYKEVAIIENNNGKTVKKFHLPATAEDINEDCDQNGGDCIYNRSSAESLYGVYNCQPPFSYPTYYYQVSLGNFDCYPYAPNPNYNWSRGDLVEESFFKEGDFTTPIKKTIYKYDIKNYDFISGVRFGYIGFMDCGPVVPCSQKYESYGLTAPTGSDYRYFKYGYYYSISAWKVLSSITEYNYFGSNIMEVKTTYDFDSPKHTLLTKKTNSNSNQIDNITEFIYPPDVSDPNIVVYTSSDVIDKMVENNMINYIIKAEESENNKKVDGTIHAFDFNTNNTNQIVTKSVYNLEGEDYAQKTENLFDIKGNPIEVHTINGLYTTYLWGYNYQYPIVKIENAKFSVVMSHLGVSYTDLQLKSSSQLIDIFNSLRQNSEMTNSRVNSYTYNPLIGTTSEIDPNGTVLNYSYDDFNRLETITDKEDLVLKHFDYCYGINLSYKPYYTHGEIETFKLTGLIDPNDYTYEWSIIHNGEFATGTDNTLTVQLTENGYFNIKCILTENESGNSQTFSEYFNVSKINCTFLDIVQHTYNTGDNSYTSTATLQSPWNEVVSLQIWCNSVGTNATNVVRVIIGDHPFNNIQSGTTLIEVPITFTNLNCEIFAQGTDRQHIMLTILSVQNNTTDLIDPLVLQLSKP